MEAFGDDAGSYSAFYPVVYEIINKERELIGVSERLEEIENDSDLAEIVELINKAMITHDEDSWENLDQRLPDFRKFSQQLFHKIDLRDGNIMRRGGQIVINDPLRAIPYGMATQLVERLTF
jgi:hypothetical protein